MGDDEYSKTFSVGNATDILIEGSERKGTGYQWGFGGTDCENQVVVGAVTHNPTMKTREFPFHTVPNAVKGTQCSVNFVFKRSWEPDPVSIKYVKKVIFIIE